MKRILVYSHDTYGLGNIRRMLTIAEHMVETHEDVSVLVVSGSPMLHAFRLSDRLDYLKLPCLTRTANGEYDVKALALSYEATIRMRSSILTTAVRDFEPDLIIVDKKPFGIDDELANALELARSSNVRPRVVLLLRDILDAPATTSSIWRKNGYFSAIDQFYDSVLVLGTQSVFDTVSKYEFPAAAAEKVKFCGYLRRPAGRVSRSTLRSSLGVDPDEKLVLVTPGGGQDGELLVGRYVQGLKNSLAPGVKTVMISGPEMSPTLQAELVAISRSFDDDRLTVIEFTDDMMSYVAASDLVVCMGGYNTVCEFLSAGRRAVVVPRVRPVEEQLIRAEVLEDKGLVTLLHPDRLSTSSLMSAVRFELDRDSTEYSVTLALSGLDLGGLDRVEKQLAVLLDERVDSPEGIPVAAL